MSAHLDMSATHFAGAGRGSGTPTRDLVLGLGKTGFACARYLSAHGHSVVVTDSRETPPFADRLARELPGVEAHAGGFDTRLLDAVDRVILSPGVRLDEPLIVAARQRGLPVLSDIDLFVSACRAPVVGITGSNGKSTVTSWLGAALAHAGRDVRIGGNLGTPALELLAGAAPDLYVLELSSFQLERSAPLPLAAAAFLNFSADHLDHHGSLADYAQAKERIFAAASVAVVNRDDPVVAACATGAARVISFGADEPAPGHYGLHTDAGSTWLARGSDRLLDVTELKLFAHHDHINALAVLALAEALDVELPAACAGVRDFSGLEHRMQLLGSKNGVRWINDSKGTNVGATLAAVAAVHSPLILIAGGDAKGADLSPLAALLTGRARAAVLLGKDADQLAGVLGPVCDVHRAADMSAAVRMASVLARRGDTVLLSPACSSLDMFADYADRGQQFIAAWRAL